MRRLINTKLSNYLNNPKTSRKRETYIFGWHTMSLSTESQISARAEKTLWQICLPLPIPAWSLKHNYPY